MTNRRTRRTEAAPAAPTEIVRATPIEQLDHLLTVNKEKLARSIPEFLKPDVFIRIALTEIQRHPDLLNCTPRSLIGALFQAAQLGLTIDSTLGHAYLVRYGNVCTLIPGYKGFIQLAYNSALISMIKGMIVRQGDDFDYREGTKPFLRHRPKLLVKMPKDDLEGVIAAYCVSQTKDGTTSFTLMSRAEVEARRERSAAWKRQKNTPWITDPVAMFKKTVTRDHCKWLPQSTEKLQMLVGLDERADAGLPQNLSDVAPSNVFDEPPTSKLDALSKALPDHVDEPAEEEEDSADDDA